MFLLTTMKSFSISKNEFYGYVKNEYFILFREVPGVFRFNTLKLMQNIICIYRISFKSYRDIKFFSVYSSLALSFTSRHLFMNLMVFFSRLGVFIKMAESAWIH